MATIQSSLRYHLVNTAAISTLISTRAYAVGEVPESVGTSDYIAWQIVTDALQKHQGGSAGLRELLLRLHCISTTERGASVLADAVRDSLTAQGRGAFGDPATPTTVRAMYEEITTSDYEPPTDASQRGMHSTPVDFTVWYLE